MQMKKESKSKSRRHLHMNASGKLSHQLQFYLLLFVNLNEIMMQREISYSLCDCDSTTRRQRIHTNPDDEHHLTGETICCARVFVRCTEHRASGSFIFAVYFTPSRFILVMKSARMLLSSLGAGERARASIFMFSLVFILNCRMTHTLHRRMFYAILCVLHT